MHEEDSSVRKPAAVRSPLPPSKEYAAPATATSTTPTATPTTHRKPPARPAAYAAAATPATPQQSSQKAPSFASSSPRPSTTQDAAPELNQTLARGTSFTQAVQNLGESVRQRKMPARKWTSKQVTAWLELLGLGQYTYHFAANGVDGHTLFELNREHVQQGLGVQDQRHLVSLEYGMLDLKERRFDGNLEEDWEWSCATVGEWLESRGLGSLKHSFADGAVHGGVLFRLTEDQFVSLLGVGSDPLILMSLIASVERAREVGPKPVSNADDSIPDWGPDRVTKWLESINLGHLDPVFRAHAVNGSVLLQLTGDLMRDIIGLTDIQAIVLERAIKRLGKKHSSHGRTTYKFWKKATWLKSILGKHMPTLPKQRKKRPVLTKNSPLKLSGVPAPPPQAGPPRRRGSSQSIVSMRKTSVSSLASKPVGYVSRVPVVSPATRSDAAWFKHSPKHPRDEISSASEGGGAAGEHSMVST